MIYFVIASSFVIMSIIGYFWIRKTNFARYYMKKAGYRHEDKTYTFEIAYLSVASISNSIMHEDIVHDHEDEEDHYYSMITNSKTPKDFIEVYRKIGFMAVQVLL